jgi:apolipoprotein N-acyltransferase
MAEAAAVMNSESSKPARQRDALKALRWSVTAVLIVFAGLGYWLAFATQHGAAAVLVAMPCLFLLARLKTPRNAFYGGAICALAMYVPHLWFFLSIFHMAAVSLWLIAALPIGIFTLLVHQSRQRFGAAAAMWITPVLWMGIEFFRSELYYLRFAWILPGQAIAFLPGARMLRLGVYGIGFLYALGAALLVGPRLAYRMVGAVALLVLAAFMYLPASPAKDVSNAPVHVAGVQLEHPSEKMAAKALDDLASAHPEAQILVMSEYSFDGPIPDSVREVARKHGRYLIAGGIVDEAEDRFRDTAFVIGPDGRDLFQQCKSVPVQFMQDGLPAEKRRVWDSPWGKIGIAICYDVSYARVMDDFVRDGARGLIVPTMDLRSWGRYEREMLHGRLAPIRAAEYGIPVFGVWSSGESQLIDRHGHVIATAGYPGPGEMIAGPFDVPNVAGHVPLDRYPALAASIFADALFIYFFASEMMTRWKNRAALARKAA